MYQRAIRYEPGEALMACSICGFTYLWPSELVHADDHLYYCRRTCWLGKTFLTDQRERAAWAASHRDESVSPGVGPAPDWATVSAAGNIVVTNLATGVRTGTPAIDGGDYQAASGALLLMCVAHSGGTLASVTSPSLSWTLVASASAGGMNAAIYAAVGSTAVAEDISINFSVPPPVNFARFSFVQVAGADAGGGAAAAVVHTGSASDASGTATSLSVSLPVFSSAANGTFGFLTGLATGAITAGNGFTEAAHLLGTSVCVESEWTSANDRTVDWTWATATAAAVGLALELRST